MSKKTSSYPEDGFSAVELLITLTIGALFVISFYQMYLVIVQVNSTARQHSVASDIAYSNLRKYTTRPAFTCNSTTDLTVNANAPGQVLSTVTTQSPGRLAGPLVETVRIYAPRGCDAAFPVKIESTAEYGNPAKRVVHSTYVN